MNLGNVTIGYNTSGDVVSASFKPAEKIDFDKKLLLQLQTIRDYDNSEKLQKNAEHVFAGWFQKVIDIELADINEHQIRSKIIRCDKYGNGLIRECEMNFYFE